MCCFASGLKGTITLASELSVTQDLTIDGPGAKKITVSGGGNWNAPLVIFGKGAAYAHAEDELRRLIDLTGLPWLSSPMGKGLIPDDHPLSTAACRTYAIQNADLVLLVGARFNWIFHFGRPPRFAPNLRVIQIDIASEEIGRNVPAEVGIVGSEAHDAPRDVLRMAEPAPGNAGDALLQPVRRHSAYHLSVHIARTDCIHRDSLHRHFQRQRHRGCPGHP